MGQKKMLAPNTKIVFIPYAGVADPIAGPTAAECVAGTDISCAIVTGYTLNPTDPDTDDSASICDAGNTVTQTYDNYEMDITFFREGVLTDTTSIYYVALNLFSNGPVQGYFVRRIGKPSTSAIVTTDVIDWYTFETDYMQTNDDRKTPVQFEIKGIPMGTLGTFKTV